MNLNFLLINIIAFCFYRVCAYQDYIIADLCPKTFFEKNFHKILPNKAEVRLGVNDKSAALIHQSWNSSSFKRFDECSFNVDATQNVSKSRNRGLYLSIRRLNLRKSPNSDECIDYIRFKFGHHRSKKFCGQLNPSVDDVSLIYFGEAGGVIKVYIFIDKSLPLKNIEDTLDIELVFTAHEECIAPDLIECFDNNCISKAFVNDGIVNCPPPHCTDENGKCPSPPVVESEPTSNSTDIVISALTSLIFTLVGVGSCLWICWHVKDCFIAEATGSNGRSSATATSNNRRPNSTRTTVLGASDDGVTLEMPTASSNDSVRPSAPPIEDKDDKPPPYEALFPKAPTQS